MTIPTTPFAGSGVRSPNPPKQVFLAFPPTTTDYKNFLLGDEWVDISSNDVYKLVSVAGAVAIWARIGGTPGDIDQVTTDSGVVTAVAGNINLLGGVGCSTSGVGDTATINVLSGGLDWQVISASQTLLVNNGYVCISGALSLTLPAVSAVGDEITVTLDGATSFTIVQQVGQQVRMGSLQTTLGVGGSITTTAQGDTLTLVCSVRNRNWNVINSMGNPVVV